MECAVVVEKVHNMVLNHIMDLKLLASKVGTKLDARVIDYNEHDDGIGLMSVTTEVHCEDCKFFDILRNEWEGTIKWVATKNHIRPNHKRKNWFIGVNFYELPEPVEIKDSDIRYETMRSSGPGGQNVNKVESAVRAIHIPTGISVVAQETRDQSINRRIAKVHLMDKLALIEKYKMDVLKADAWSEHTALQRGGQIKTFKGEL